jgi:hypothetical protein
MGQIEGSLFSRGRSVVVCLIVECANCEGEGELDTRGVWLADGGTLLCAKFWARLTTRGSEG